MRNAKLAVVANTCIFFFLFSLILYPSTILSKVDSDLKVKHKPIKYFVPGKRIQLEANVKDSAGIRLVRCYFRASDIADYVFVEMTAAAKDEFKALLPAPSPGTKALEYLFLVVNGLDQVIKTQVFKIDAEDEKEPPAWQQVDSGGQINIGTEIVQPAAQPAGFTDNIAMDLVESSIRFGAVAGLYSASQVAAAGGTTGSAAAATGGGTVTASTGFSTATIVGMGVGVAALAGGAAAAGGGGDGGGGSDPADSTTPSESQPAPVENACDVHNGIYYGSYESFDCEDVQEKGASRLRCNRDCSGYVWVDDGPGIQWDVTWNFTTDSDYTLRVDDHCGGQYWNGSFTDSRTSGTITFEQGGSGSFSATKR